MRKILSIVLLTLALLACTPAISVPNQQQTAALTQNTGNPSVKVWVNTNSGVYHCPGTRWYGNTKKGEYVGECEAIKAGNRPAYGRACGSDCPSALSTERSASPSA